jgi:hypothetical protein
MPHSAMAISKLPILLEKMFYGRKKYYLMPPKSLISFE